jgi:phosphohistidine phosphatase
MIIRVYFLRHGEADWPKWEGDDDDRPLTERGRKEMRKVARFLDALDLSLDDILTSPLPRAQQTAEIVAERFKLHAREEDALAKNFDVPALKQIVRKYSVENLMIVGHEPNFTEVISGVTGATLKLSKGGVALVELDDEKMKGRLLWLFPPKLAKVSV